MWLYTKAPQLREFISGASYSRGLPVASSSGFKDRYRSVQTDTAPSSDQTKPTIKHLTCHTTTTTTIGTSGTITTIGTVYQVWRFYGAIDSRSSYLEETRC